MTLEAVCEKENSAFNLNLVSELAFFFLHPYNKAASLYTVPVVDLRDGDEKCASARRRCRLNTSA